MSEGSATIKQNGELKMQIRQVENEKSIYREKLYELQQAEEVRSHKHQVKELKKAELHQRKLNAVELAKTSAPTEEELERHMADYQVKAYLEHR